MVFLVQLDALEPQEVLDLVESKDPTAFQAIEEPLELLVQLETLARLEPQEMLEDQDKVDSQVL